MAKKENHPLKAISDPKGTIYNDVNKIYLSYLRIQNLTLQKKIMIKGSI